MKGEGPQGRLVLIDFPERARSLSPIKDATSNAGTPNSMRSTTDASMQDLSSSPANTQLPSPSHQQRAGEEIMAKEASSRPASSIENSGTERRKSPSPSISPKPSSNLSSAAMPLSRSGTLSWQQRPSSRGTITGRNRPLSIVASENRASKSPRGSVEPTTAQDGVTSRSEIAQTLGAKDAAFFRQREDRGLGSAAFRKNQADQSTDLASAVGTRHLPGLLRETSIEQEKSSASPPGSARWSSPSREGSVRGGSGSTHRFTNSTSAGNLRSPLPTMDSQRFEPPTSDTSSSHGAESTSSGRTLAMSPSQGRMIAERMDHPPSPTKGLGGFVQSAMLKRSDSVNKRWSAQAGPGLSRGNSITSNRSGYDGSRPAMGGFAPLQDSRPSGTSRETSPVSGSRPGSDYGNFTTAQPVVSKESASVISPKVETKPSALLDNTFVKPAPTLRKDVSSFSDVGRGRAGEEDAENGAPASPSKRWSPSKSSWLENAINKPDSPKPKAAPPQQPSWMADLNKTKQQRGSIDFGQGSSFKEVSTGGLMRSPPPGGFDTAPSISKFSSGFGVDVSGKPKVQTPSESKDVKSPVGQTLIDVKSPSRPKIGVSNGESPSQSDEAGLLDQSPVTTSQPTFKSSSPVKVFVDSKTSPSTKPKPETPPKKDFTSNLKTRKVSVGKASKDEPEFKNVFGKLKKTQTQNYVAPDELKDNILRGKAGLASSGGPQKSQHKDEFKQSILQKKETMKAGLPSASTTITSASMNQGTTVSEALAKSQGLSRSSSNINTAASPKVNQSHLASGHTSPTAGVPTASPEPQKQSPVSTKLGDNFNTSLAGILSRGPSPMKSGSDFSLPEGSIAGIDQTTATSQASTSTTQLSHMTKGRARGPKRRLPTTADQSASTATLPPSSTPGSQHALLADRTQYKPAMNSRQIVSPIPKVEGSRPLSNISNNNRKVSQPTSPRKSSTSITPNKEVKPQSPATQPFPLESPMNSTKTSPMIKQKPTLTTSARSPNKPSVSVKQPTEPDSIETIDPQNLAAKVTLPDPIQKTHDSKPANEIIPSSSVKVGAAVWQQSIPVQRNGARSPITLPTRKDEEAAHEKAGLGDSSSTTSIGLGIGTDLNKPRTPAPFVRSLPTPPALSPRSPKSPPLPGKKPASIAPRKPSSTVSPKPPPPNNSSPTSEAARLISDFFSGSAKSIINFNVDTQNVLASCSSHEGPEKIKTLRKQIFEVAGGGKLIPVPSQQEHILFEENLYICTHVFGGLSGTRTTEVYLWSGDCVSVSAVEDAQLFARKIAKDNNGKLVILRQGKETSKFFQALGGIVITRRGSSTRGGSPSSSTASYMLCARRHVGQIAFDEVDMSPASLCRGFPYIIFTRFNKLYLWKGSGSGADELGCARLIGMDIGLTGEVEEVDEGQEPPAFWRAFPGGKQEQSPSNGVQHWHLKSSCEKYTTRLFTIGTEAPRPKSNPSYLSWGRRGSATPASEDDGTMNTIIKEVMPFAQADLADDGVYVLDTFFEIFV